MKKKKHFYDTYTNIIFDIYRWLNKLNRKDSDDLPWTQQED